MTRIAKCYAKIFAFSKVLLFEQIKTLKIVQYYDKKRQNPHYSYNATMRVAFCSKSFSKHT